MCDIQPKVLPRARIHPYIRSFTIYIQHHIHISLYWRPKNKTHFCVCVFVHSSSLLAWRCYALASLIRLLWMDASGLARARTLKKYNRVCCVVESDCAPRHQHHHRRRRRTVIWSRGSHIVVLPLAWNPKLIYTHTHTLAPSHLLLETKNY